jgi:hypothetical protein
MRAAVMEPSNGLDMFDDLIEKLIIHYTGPRYESEVAAAKTEFFDEAGIVDEESIHFEMRMTQFQEWYLFTRKMRTSLVPPTQFALTDPDFKMTEGDRALYNDMAAATHSLFEFQKIRGEDVYIKDLFSGEKTIIRNSRVQIGFSREEFFEARLIPNSGEFIFGKAFCFHPEDARKYVLTEVDKIKNGDHELHDALMLRLLKMRYKYEQYRHLKLTDVYTNERKVRF